MVYVFQRWVFIREIKIRLENVMRFYCYACLAQLSPTVSFSKFPFLWNSGSVMDYVSRKWVFIWKILIWLENVMRFHCCTRLAQLSTTFYTKISQFLWISGPVMVYVFRKWVFIWKTLIWLENVMSLYCCTRVAQLSTTFYSSKFAFLWNSGSVMDYLFRKWVFIWNILVWLKNVMTIYYCTRLAQLSTTCFFKNSHFCKIPGRWWSMYFESEFSFGKH